MQDSYEIVKATAAALMAFVLAFIGWQSKRANDKIQEFPEKYVMKIDFNDTLTRLMTELHLLRTEHKQGLERINDRIDKVLDQVVHKSQ